MESLQKSIFLHTFCPTTGTETEGKKISKTKQNKNMQAQILQGPINPTEFPLCRVRVSTQTKPPSVLPFKKKKGGGPD